MSSFGARVGAVLVLGCAGLACSARPLDPDRRSQGAGGTAAGGSSEPTRGTGGMTAGRDAGTTTGFDAAAEVSQAHDAVADLPGPDGPPDGGADGTPDVGSDGAVRGPRMLSLVLDGAPWYASQSTGSISVDARGKVYVGDYANVFMVDVPTAAVTTYLTAAEAGGNGFGDHDIGPDGRLYIVMSRTVAGTLGIVRSSQAHQAEWWVDLSPTLMEAGVMGVIGDGYIGITSRAGFWTFTDGGGKLVYDKTQLVSTDSCANLDLAVARSGTFLYQPGCNGYPLLRGHADGSGVGPIYTTAVSPPNILPASNFSCSARDPSGGFYFIIQDVDDYAPRLYHMTEDAQGTSGLTWTETTPSFLEAKKRVSNVYGFDFCALAAANDGTVYFQSYAQLWMASP